MQECLHTDVIAAEVVDAHDSPRRSPRSTHPPRAHEMFFLHEKFFLEVSDPQRANGTAQASVVKNNRAEILRSPVPASVLPKAEILSPRSEHGRDTPRSHGEHKDTPRSGVGSMNGAAAGVHKDHVGGAMNGVSANFVPSGAESQTETSASTSPDLGEHKGPFALERKNSTSGGGRNLPILQFTNADRYAAEGETIQVYVMRIGSHAARNTVDFCTADSSEFAGRKFIPTSGTLVFEPGQVEKCFPVTLCEDELFESTVEFGVKLSNPDPGCQLGMYLWQCRIKILDNDVFPTNKYHSALVSGKIRSIPGLHLFVELCKFHLNFSPDTWKILVLDQLENVDFCLGLFIRFMAANLFVDVLAGGSPDDEMLAEAKSALGLFAVGLFLPKVLLHFIAILRRKLRVMGEAVLQKNLLRKFLNLDEKARSEVSTAVFIKCITEDTNFVLHKGYWSFIRIAQLFGRLIGMVVFVIATSEELLPTAMALAVLAAFPAVLFTFLTLRAKDISHYKAQLTKAEHAVHTEVEDTVDHYRLVVDYNKRPLVVEELGERVQEFYHAFIQDLLCRIHNEMFPVWLSSGVQLIWMIFGGNLVIAADEDARITVGSFFSVLAIFGSVGETWVDIYKTSLEIQANYGAVYRITEFLNLPTDVWKRKNLEVVQLQMKEEKMRAARAVLTIQKYTRRLVQRYRARKLSAGGEQKKKTDLASHFLSLGSETRLDNSGEAEIADTVPIEIWKCSFGYSEGESVLRGLNLKVPQGTLAGFTGPTTVGKNTLLQIFGQVLIPESGLCFVPQHLRVLHVAQGLYFLSGSIQYNTFLGVLNSSSDLQTLSKATLERGRRICERLELQPKLISAVMGQLEVPVSALSRSDKALLCVARALICNPEVLVIHQPGVHLCVPKKDSLMRLLREFVDNRGLEMDPDTIAQRRPRTCFFSSNEVADLQYADQVFLCKAQSVKEVKMQEVSEHIQVEREKWRPGRKDTTEREL